MLMDLLSRNLLMFPAPALPQLSPREWSDYSMIANEPLHAVVANYLKSLKLSLQGLEQNPISLAHTRRRQSSWRSLAA